MTDSETHTPAGPALTRDGDVFVLHLGDHENRFNADFVAALNTALDEVEAADGPRALVTAATGKFYSNGLDLAWLSENPDRVQETIDAYHQLLGRILGLGVPTVAAIGGHAFAAGAMFAVAHDHAVMREDRGFWCVPEADLGMPFTPGMTALLTARLPTRTAHTAMTTARRYAGPQALAAGIVDAVADQQSVLGTAIEAAAGQAAKNPDTLGKIKQRLYAPAIAALQRSQEL